MVTLASATSSRSGGLRGKAKNRWGNIGLCASREDPFRYYATPSYTMPTVRRESKPFVGYAHKYWENTGSNPIKEVSLWNNFGTILERSFATFTTSYLSAASYIPSSSLIPLSISIVSLCGPFLIPEPITYVSTATSRTATSKVCPNEESESRCPPTQPRRSNANHRIVQPFSGDDSTRAC